MCILAYVPHFKTIERFSITFQTANAKREFVRLLFTPAKKIISFSSFSSIRIVLDCSYQHTAYFQV